MNLNNILPLIHTQDKAKTAPEAAPEETVKKKRGRPRKEKIEVEEDEYGPIIKDEYGPVHINSEARTKAWLEEENESDIYA